MLIARRLRDDGPEILLPSCEWQMPQGGIDQDENAYAAARRELWEETAVVKADYLGKTRSWMSYDFPPYDGPWHRLCAFRGQRQRWYAFRFMGHDDEIDVSRGEGGADPEFSVWRWELLDAHPWPFLLSTVDTVEARWAIQSRAAAGAEILDAAVLDLLYSVLRVAPGGWCLECKHPFDPDLMLKQRAARWGQSFQTVREWTSDDVTVTDDMIRQLALTQNRLAEHYADLRGAPFHDVPRLTECGETALRTDVPSQAAVLPIATTPAGALLAAEVAKHYAAPDAQLRNWLAHDLARSPDRPKIRYRPPVNTCPRHG